MKLQVPLPDAFVRFMGNLELQDQVPSCTACYFDLSTHIAKSPFGDDGYFIRFLNDQQWVLLWHLYIRPNGDHCVVVSDAPLDGEHLLEVLNADEEPVSFDTIQRDTFFCAPGFEEFIYRFWLENHLWFALTEGWPMTEAQLRYLRHYKA